MKKQLMYGLLGAALISAAGISTVIAADAPAAKPAKAEKAALKEETIKGTVEITKDDKGAMKECDLKTADGTTYVCSPASECKMLEADSGKVVECAGVVTEKDGKKHLHVKSINAHPTP